MLYIFAHFSVIILSTYYYNCKLRDVEDQNEVISSDQVNKIETLIKILE